MHRHNLKKRLTGGKVMFDFSIVLVSIVGAGSLAFSFVEYVLARKKKLSKMENDQ
jgi:hypothetical protein